MDEVASLCMKVREFFENENEDLGIPFFYSFPKNCCEGASCFLGLLLMEVFPYCHVEVVHGVNHDAQEHHFWLEVDGLIYDVTADQFIELNSPVYGDGEHPMATHFYETKKEYASVFFCKYTEKFLEMDKASVVYKKLRNKFSQYV